MSAFVKRIVWADVCIGRLEWAIAGLCLLVIVLTTGLGVFFRYVLNNPLIWSNDTGIVSLTWLTFIGGSALYKQRGHIAVEALNQLFSGRLNTVFTFALTVIMGGAIAVIGWQMLTLVPLQHTKVIESLHLPRSAYGLPLAWASFSITFSSLRQLLDGSLIESTPNEETGG